MTRVLIAEDEPLMRERLAGMLATCWPEAEVVLQAENGNDAWDGYLEHEPEVVFLDIRMPGLSGLEVAERIGDSAHVVFVTAYDQYAVEAFDAGAVDYLLKPVQPARLEQAVARLRERLQERRAGADGPDLHALIDGLESRLRPQGERLIRWISASAGDSVRMFGIDEVLFFQAQEKYVRVVTSTGEGVIRTPLKELLAGLDPDAFWQVHRGTVVKVQAIDRVSKNELGRHSLSLKGHAERLPVSGAFLHRFRGM